MPYQIAQARTVLFNSRLWPQAQAQWPLRYAFSEKKTREKLNPDGPRYKALGNSMAVPVMHWIGKRIQMVEDL
jgi:site-specific DNA-cytosine methylase